MVIFACGVIASYMLTNYTNLHMRKLAIWVDAAGLGLTALLPDWFSPIAGVYPIFFCQRILRPAEDGLFEVVCDEDRRAVETICARFGLSQKRVLPEPEPPITSTFLFLAVLGSLGG